MSIHVCLCKKLYKSVLALKRHQIVCPEFNIQVEMTLPVGVMNTDHKVDWNLDRNVHDLIKRCIKAHGMNIYAASRALGTTRNRLYRILNK